MMEIEKSSIVKSLAGHDKGNIFYVIDTQGEYVLLADGKGRKIERPKRKKLKHVALEAKIESRVSNKLRNGDKVLNSELRRELAEYSQTSTLTGQTQGR